MQSLQGFYSRNYIFTKITFFNLYFLEVLLSFTILLNLLSSNPIGKRYSDVIDKCLTYYTFNFDTFLKQIYKIYFLQYNL